MVQSCPINGLCTSRTLGISKELPLQDVAYPYEEVNFSQSLGFDNEEDFWWENERMAILGAKDGKMAFLCILSIS